MNVQSLHDRFVWNVRRAYGIERQLVGELETLAADVGVDALDDLRGPNSVSGSERSSTSTDIRLRRTPTD